MRFILWDPRDGEPRRAEDGSFISDGLIGRIDEGNVYLTGYAEYHDGQSHRALDVGQFAVATFSLSGSRGVYRVYRVE